MCFINIICYHIISKLSSFLYNINILITSIKCAFAYALLVFVPSISAIFKQVFCGRFGLTYTGCICLGAVPLISPYLGL